MYYLFLAVSATFDAVMSMLDANESDKGIKTGVGVEASEILDTLVHTNKPSHFELIAYNFAFMALVIGTALLCRFLTGHNEVAKNIVSLMTNLILCVDGVSHYQGYRQWKWCLAHPTEKMPQPTSVWGKFFGFWG